MDSKELSPNSYLNKVFKKEKSPVKIKTELDEYSSPLIKREFESLNIQSPLETETKKSVHSRLGDVAHSRLGPKADDKKSVSRKVFKRDAPYEQADEHPTKRAKQSKMDEPKP